jgi:hypothetical protein
VDGNPGAEVAAVRPVPLIAQPLHEPMPEAGDIGPVDAGVRRTLREGDGADGVGGGAAKRRGGAPQAVSTTVQPIVRASRPDP